MNSRYQYHVDFTKIIQLDGDVQYELVALPINVKNCQDRSPFIGVKC